ncbi:MAG: glycosyltransferase family 2 protein [Eubacterium sp.]|nr:glycosyltransferase family 2 protein [Eubacterium sp.]
MDLSFVIPCYNEQGNVEKFFDESEKVFALSGIKYEYVFVNDGSSDKTGEALKSLFETHVSKNISIIDFSRNFGKESAIYAGLQHASGKYICIIDADLQQRPETALDMYKFITSNRDFDCVCAYQNVRKEGKIMSGMKALFYKLMNTLAETEFKNGASDFRLFNTKVRDAILSLGEYHRFSKGIFSWVGFNVHYMEYRADERNSGETKWSFGKLVRYAISGIIAFSTAPLKLAIYIGTGATIFSLIYLIVTVIRKLTSHINVDGFTQLVILITFFAGITLVILGIIGEYIAKIYQQVKNRPIYIAKDVMKRNNLN